MDQIKGPIVNLSKKLSEIFLNSIQLKNNLLLKVQANLRAEIDDDKLFEDIRLILIDHKLKSYKNTLVVSGEEFAKVYMDMFGLDELLQTDVKNNEDINRLQDLLSVKVSHKQLLTEQVNEQTMLLKNILEIITSNKPANNKIDELLKILIL